MRFLREKWHLLQEWWKTPSCADPVDNTVVETFLSGVPLSSSMSQQIASIKPNILLTVGKMDIHAETWHDALLFWYLDLTPIPEGMETHKIYDQKIKHPTDGPMFMVLIMAAIERQTGRDPIDLRVHLTDSGEIHSNITYEDFCRRAVEYLEERQVLAIFR